MDAFRVARLGQRPTFSRRRALHAAGGGLSTLAGLRLLRPSAAAQSGTPIAATGQPAAELATVEAVMDDLMARWELPGGQLAVAKDGRLVLDRGYGLADVEAGEPVQPTSLFRIASVTKAITAVAILTLVDAGSLSLDDAVFPLLDFAPPAHATTDPRLASITV
jgi:N-acyl-D-amino-acid deacylase